MFPSSRPSTSIAQSMHASHCFVTPPPTRSCMFFHCTVSSCNAQKANIESMCPNKASLTLLRSYSRIFQPLFWQGCLFQTWTRCIEKQIQEPKAVVTEERPRNSMRVLSNISKAKITITSAHVTFTIILSTAFLLLIKGLCFHSVKTKTWGLLFRTTKMKSLRLIAKGTAHFLTRIFQQRRLIDC